MTRSVRLAILLTLLFACLSDPASAERKRDRMRDVPPQQEFAPGNASQSRITLEEAIARVQQRTGGKVLDARHHGDHYRVKVLQDGEVRVHRVDARTGAIH